MREDPRDVKETEAQRALGVVRSSKYRTPSAAKSSAASRAILVMQACVVVHLWTASKSLKHSGSVCAPVTPALTLVSMPVQVNQVSAPVKLHKTALALPDCSAQL